MSEERKLTPERVDAIMLDCLFGKGEKPTQYILAEGIVRNYGLNPKGLAKHKAEIIEMLDEPPDNFMEGAGGGWSFLNACDDKRGHQWTGEHRRMEALFALGIAIGKVELLLPREMWSMLPGGMPYYLVRNDCKEVAVTAA